MHAQPRLAFDIGSGPKRMLPAIQFDDKLATMADEIDGERTYRRLPAKTEAGEPTAAEFFPQMLLRIRHAGP